MLQPLMNVARGLESARRVACVAIAGLAIGLSATGALAQGGGGGGGGGGRGGGGGGPMMMMGMGRGGMEASITSEQLDRYSTMLAFTDDQRTAAKALFEGFLAGAQERATKMRAAVEEVRQTFQETRDPSVWQDLGPKMQEFRTQGQTAEKGFFDDMKSLLTPEQANLWPVVERARRRETGMGQGFGQLSGERVDLVKLVERMELSGDSRAKVSPMLESYEQELDRELIRRIDANERLMGEGMGMMQAVMSRDEAAMKKAEEMVTAAREAGMKVRDTNRRYAAQIEGVLSADEAAKFQAEFKRESFPMVYGRPRFAQQLIDAAGKFEDLSAQQRESLTAIKDGYTRDSNALNTRGEKAIQEQEESFTIARMMSGGFMGMGGEAMRELRQERTRLEDTTERKIREILTPEQVAKLPERRRGEGDGAGPGGMGGGGENQDRPRRRPGRGNNENTPAGAPRPGGG